MVWHSLHVMYWNWLHAYAQFFFIWSDTPYGFSWRWVDARAVASLTVPGGQEFHFPHFFLKSRFSFLIFPQTFTHTLRHWLMPLRQYLINVLTPPTCYILKMAWCPTLISTVNGVFTFCISKMTRCPWSDTPYVFSPEYGLLTPPAPRAHTNIKSEWSDAPSHFSTDDDLMTPISTVNVLTLPICYLLKVHGFMLPPTVFVCPYTTYVLPTEDDLMLHPDVYCKWPATPTCCLLKRTRCSHPDLLFNGLQSYMLHIMKITSCSRQAFWIHNSHLIRLTQAAGSPTYRVKDTAPHIPCRKCTSFVLHHWTCCSIYFFTNWFAFSW